MELSNPMYESGKLDSIPQKLLLLIQRLLMNNHVFFLDTETTSQDQTIARVVEIAIISDIEKIEEKINPQTPISIGAMATHHITEKMIA